MDAIERWVQEAFAPVVLTFSTPEVERIAQKNALSFADLLNGFAALSDVDVPVRSVSHALRLTSFNYRFLPARQFGTLPISDATRHLNESVARHPPKGGPVVDLQIPRVESVDDVPVYLRAIGADPDNSEPFSWYREFKLTLMDTFRCEEYSMMCHPAAMLVVVSSTDANPRQSFQELASPQNLPPSFMQGLYDPALVPKFYVVLHDAGETEGTSIDPEAILRSLNIAEGTGAVIRVNSNANAPQDPATTAANSAIWSAHPYVRPALFPAADISASSAGAGSLGSLLSQDDITGLRAFVRDFGLRFVLSAMESRIFQLNDIVSAMKKGVKNVFKSWLRKPKDLSSRPSNSNGNGGAGGNGAITYRYDSIESQTRLLADTAFLVRDYELALQMYRLARDDFKSDKSIFHCANANEMIALCLLLNRGSPMQITNALDSANAAYAKVNTLVASRLAVRTAVIAGEIYNALSHMGLFTDYMDNASAALIRGSTMEQGICSAVLMERAALCDLHARQPKFRKYGFRMVMAGHIYDSLGHSPHSARCYSLARAIYDCSGWFQVEDHINFTLAQQANRLNDPMASINLFLKLIGTGRNSASQQEALLYEFGLIVKEILLTTTDGASNTSRSGPVSIFQDGRGENKLLVKDLCMPELDDKSTVVFAPVNAVGIDRSIDGNESDADTWKQLEELVDKQNRLHQYATSNDTVSNPDKSANRWFAPAHFYAMPYRNKRNAAKKPANYALGEQIYVEFVMKNALSCAVDVENIHLFGKFEPLDGGDVFNVPEPIKRTDDDSEEAIAAAAAAASERVAVASVNLQLLPVSEERVRLAICPKVPGKLTIVGVQWSICGGDVHGEHAFDIPGPLLQDTRAHKEARARAPNTSLVANVVGEMPWLGVEIDCDARDVFVGEVVQMRVSVFNAGSAAVTGLQCSSKSLMLCASVSPPDTPSAGHELAGYIGASGQVVDLSAVTLEPDEKKVFTLWARASSSGRQQVPLLFQYSGPSADNGGVTGSRSMSSSPLKRVVKVKVALNVVPCVDVAYSVEPSLAHSGEFILGISVANQRTDAVDASAKSSTVQLEQLLCVSKYWTVEKFAAPLPSETLGVVSDANRLRYQEASTSYFRLKPRGPSTVSVYQPYSIPLTSDSSFGSEGGVAKLPLEQFLCLDNALGMVKSASAGDGDGSNGDAKAGAGAGGGGLRSIQSVRRENKALKANQDNSTVGGEANDTVVQSQPTTKEALLSARDVDGHLVLVWSAACTSSSDGDNERRAVGQSNFTSIQVRSPLQPQSCPLNVTLEYADNISLNPASSNGIYFSQLDFVMHISNTASIDSPPIDFTVELLHPEEASSAPAEDEAAVALFPGGGKSTGARRDLPYSVPLNRNALPRRSSSPHFFWTGVTKKTISQFAPNARASIRMSACFVAPGVYNLNRFRVVMLPSQSTKGSVAAAFAFPADHLVYANPPRPSSPTTENQQTTAAGIPAAEPLVAVP